MLKIFLSSTYRDLAEYRMKAFDEINKVFEGVGMENFVPDGSSPQEVCINQLKNSNIVIFLISPYYGSLMEKCTLLDQCKAECPMKTGQGRISYTHCEYKNTIVEGIPHQIYLISEGWEDLLEIKDLPKNKIKIKKLKKQPFFSDQSDDLISHYINIRKEACQFRQEIGKKKLWFEINDTEDVDTITKIKNHLAENLLKWYTDKKIYFSEFIDRREELNKLINGINNRVEVYGVGGVGKTSLIQVALLVESLKGRKIYVVGTSQTYASGSGYSWFREKLKENYHEVIGDEIMLDDIIDTLARDFPDVADYKSEKPKIKIDRLSKLIQSESILLFIDDAHLANKEVEDFILKNKSIVLSSRRKTGLAQKEIYLVGIPKNDRKSLINLLSARYDLKLKPKIIDKIKEIGEGHPITTEILVKNFEKVNFDKLKSFKPETFMQANSRQIHEFLNRIVEEILKNNENAFKLARDLAIINTEISTNINREILGKVNEDDDFFRAFNELIDTRILKKKEDQEGNYEFTFKHIQEALKIDVDPNSHKKAIEYYKKKASEYGDNINNKVEILFHKAQLNPTVSLIEEFIALSREIKPKNQGYKRLIDIGENLSEVFKGDQKATILKTLGNLYIYLNRFQIAEEKYKGAAKFTDNLEKHLNENINNLLQAKEPLIYELYEDFKANYISLICTGKSFEKSPWIKLKEHLLEYLSRSDDEKIKEDLRQIFLFFLNIIGFDPEKKNFFYEAKALAEIIVDENTINLESAFSCMVYNHLCLIGNSIQEPIEELALKTAQLYQSWASNYKKEKETISYVEVLEMVAWHYHLAQHYEESAEKYLELSNLRDEEEEVNLIKIIYQMAATNFEACNKDHQAGEIYYKLAMLMEESQKFSELAIEYYQNAISKIDKSSDLYKKIDEKMEEAKIKITKLKKELSEKEPKKMLLMHNQYDRIAADIIASHAYVNNVDCSHGIPVDYEDYLRKDKSFNYIILFGGPTAPLTGFFSHKMFGNEKDYVKLYNVNTKYGNVWNIQRKGKYFLVAGTTTNSTVKSANKFVNGNYL
jgi:tetratricopeptide (TPR) repeat protein